MTKTQLTNNIPISNSEKTDRLRGRNPGDRLEEFYRQMFRIRIVEEKVLELFAKGLLMGTTHTCIGQEGCAVGVIGALERTKDIVFSNHRGHGHYLAFCGDVRALLCELMGRPAGASRGLGGSQHLHHQNYFSSGIQGSLVPVALGVALAQKIKQTQSVTVIFMGDGTLAEGTVYEGFNVAALWELPLLFVVEANQYAQSTPSHLQHSADIAARAKSFGIASREVKEAHVEEVYCAAREAVDYVRRHGKGFRLPKLIERAEVLVWQLSF